MQGEAKWHVMVLNPAYPQVQFASVPPALQPLLPLTTQASLKPVRSPGGIPIAIPPNQAIQAIPVPAPMIAPRMQVAPAPGLQMQRAAPSR